MEQVRQTDLFLPEKNTTEMSTVDIVKKELQTDIIDTMREDLEERKLKNTIKRDLLNDLHSMMKPGSEEQLNAAGKLKFYEILIKSDNDKIKNYVDLVKPQMAITTNVNSGNKSAIVKNPTRKEEFTRQEMLEVRELLKNNDPKIIDAEIVKE